MTLGSLDLDQLFAVGQNLITVHNRIPPLDFLDVILRVVDQSDVLLGPLMTQLSLGDSDGTVFSSTALPLALPDFNEWESTLFKLNEVDIWGLNLVQGNLDSFFVVPEPSAVLLLAFSLAALGWGRRGQSGRIHDADA